MGTRRDLAMYRQAKQTDKATLTTNMNYVAIAVMMLAVESTRANNAH